MNRKLIRGLLIVSLFIGTLGSISSCKDTDEDMRVEFKKEYLTLKDYMDQQLQNEINKLNLAISQCKTDCAAARKALEEKLYGDGTNKGDIPELQERLSKLELLLQNYEANITKLNNLYTLINGTTEDPSTGILSRLIELERIIAINNLPDDPNTPGKKIELPDIWKKALDAYNQADLNKKTLEKIDTILKNLPTFDPSELEKRIAANDSLIKDTKKNLETADSIMNVAIENLADSVGRLDTKVEQYNTAIKAQLATMQEEIDELTKRVTKLEDRLNAMVTSVIVQAVENPIFGSFALPVNVQSNILLGYIGYCELAQIDFPRASLNNEYNGETVITSEDWKRIGGIKGEALSAVKGERLFTGEAGKVYLTVNPNNVDFSGPGKSISLVNSQDVASGVELSDLKASDRVLTFGYTYGTRSANNGFYEAVATINPEKAEEVRVVIDPELKSAMKDALQAPHTRQDFVKLIKAIYDQFNGILPANAVKAQWSVGTGADLKTYAVYSNYNVAAAAFKPLSFKFLYGKEINRKFPQINPIELPEINLKDYINFDDLKMPEITIDEEKIKFNLNISDIKINNLGQITITVDMPTNFRIENGEVKYDVVPQDYYISEEEMKKLADQIAQSIGDSLSGDIQGAIDDVVKQIVEEIQRAMEEALSGKDGLLTQITDKFDALNDKLNDQIRSNFGAYVDKLNNYIGRINSLTNRLNNVLKDPNHYLQVTLLYSYNGSYHQLSNNKLVPTMMQLAGGDAMLLFPTTYTAEIVAPAYKKYVAVTNVTGPDAAVASKLMKEANDQDYVNIVVDGGRLTVPFKVSNESAGYTYEIAYSALDYAGVTSTQKFYVKVVK